MKRRVVLATLWFACGLYTWGTLMAHLDQRWAGRHEHSRDHTWFCAGISVLGPIGAVAAAICTNFNQHGWELWEQP